MNKVRKTVKTIILVTLLLALVFVVFLGVLIVDSRAYHKNLKTVTIGTSLDSACEEAYYIDPRVTGGRADYAEFSYIDVQKRGTSIEKYTSFSASFEEYPVDGIVFVSAKISMPKQREHLLDKLSNAYFSSEREKMAGTFKRIWTKVNGKRSWASVTYDSRNLTNQTHTNMGILLKYVTADYVIEFNVQKRVEIATFDGEKEFHFLIDYLEFLISNVKEPGTPCDDEMIANYYLKDADDSITIKGIDRENCTMDVAFNNVSIKDFGMLNYSGEKELKYSLNDGIYTLSGEHDDKDFIFTIDDNSHCALLDNRRFYRNLSNKGLHYRDNQVDFEEIDLDLNYKEMGFGETSVLTAKNITEFGSFLDQYTSVNGNVKQALINEYNERFFDNNALVFVAFKYNKADFGANGIGIIEVCDTHANYDNELEVIYFDTTLAPGALDDLTYKYFTLVVPKEQIGENDITIKLHNKGFLKAEFYYEIESANMPINEYMSEND